MSLHIHFTHGSEFRRVPKELQDYMRKRYILTAEFLAGLRCFEFGSTVGDKPVRRFRIFELKEMRKTAQPIKSIQDLDRYPGLTIFEGYIDQNGVAYAADRRMPKTKKKIAEK